MTKEQWQEKMARLRGSEYVRLHIDDQYVNPNDIVSIGHTKIYTADETTYLSFSVTLVNGKNIEEYVVLPERTKVVKGLFGNKTIKFNKKDYMPLLNENTDEEIYKIAQEFFNRQRTFVKDWTNSRRK